MSAAEIIAQLPRLSAEELAQVQAKLRELVDAGRHAPQPPRIRSPRLVHPGQSKDFVKQVVELPPDAKLLRTASNGSPHVGVTLGSLASSQESAPV